MFSIFCIFDFFRVKEVDQQSKKLLADLEWNPRSIYQTIIQREETETGVKSSKNHDASAEECLQNDEVREIMTKNLSTLSRLVEGKAYIWRISDHWRTLLNFLGDKVWSGMD